MSLIYMQGFDGVSNTDLDKVFADSSYNLNAASIVDQGRFGGNCVRSNSGTVQYHLHIKFTDFGYSVGEEFIMGFAVRNVSGINTLLIQPLASGSYTNAWSIRADASNNKIYLVTNNSSDPQYDYPLPVGSWAYVEWRYKMAQSGGRYQVKINGSEIIDYTGDTQYSTSINCFGVEFSNQAWWVGDVDDIYFIMNDSIGLTDFLGECKVNTIFPNGAGNSSQLTPNGQSNNYQCVNENPMDTDNYVEGNNDGQKDTYSYQDVPTDLDDSKIYGVAVQSVAQRTQPIANINLKNLLRSNSVDYEGSQTHVLGDSFVKYKQDVWETDPNDSNVWTKSKINACEFGVEIETT